MSRHYQARTSGDKMTMALPRQPKPVCFFENFVRDPIASEMGGLFLGRWGLQRCGVVSFAGLS
jgi:hypothetical protein